MNELDSKINEAIKEEFVGNFLFSKEELDDLYFEVGKIFKNAIENDGMTILDIFDKKIFVAIVNVAKTWDPNLNSSLFQYILKKLCGINESQKIHNHINNVITNLYNKSQIRAIDLEGTKKYYATILMHSFAPQASTEAFFGLCWQIYCNDLGFNYFKGDELYTIAAKELKKRLSKISDDDQFSLGSQTYQFRAGINSLAKQYPEVMAEQIEKTIYYIDKLFNGGLVETKNQFNCLLVNWWKEVETKLGESKNNREHYDRPISDYSLIKAQYISKDGDIIIRMPSIRLNKNCDINPRLKIFVDGKEFKYLQLSLVGSGLTMATKVEEYKLDEMNFASNKVNIRVQLEHNGELIYDSGTSLTREFILFRNGKEVLYSECYPDIYELYILNTSMIKTMPAEAYRISKNRFYIEAKEDEELLINQKHIIFRNKMAKHNINFGLVKRNDLLFYKDNIEYQVVDGDVWVSIEKGTNPKDYGIKIDEGQYKLVDFPHFTNGEVICYTISKLLKPGVPETISLFKFVDGKLKSTIDVVQFTNISISYDKNLYYGEDSKGIAVFHSNRISKNISFNINQEEILIPFENGDMRIFPPIFKWKFWGEEYQTKPLENALWYKEIPNAAKIKIGSSLDFTYRVCLSCNCYVPEDKTGINSYKIGEIVYDLAENKKTFNRAVVFANIENSKPLELFRINLKNYFIDKPYDMFGYHAFAWTPKEVFAGDKNIYFKLELLRYNETVKTIDLSFKKQVVDLKELPDGKYHVRISCVPNKGFAKSTLMEEYDEILGNPMKFKFARKEMVIRRVKLADRGRTVDTVPYFIDHIKFLGDKGKSSYFSGRLYVETNSGEKYYLDKMKNNYGVLENINPIRIEIGEQKNACFIVTNVDENDYEMFDGELTLNIDKLWNQDRAFTKAIDYYYFETREKKNV